MPVVRFQNTVAQIHDRDCQFEDEHMEKQTKKCTFYFIRVISAAKMRCNPKLNPQMNSE